MIQLQYIVCRMKEALPYYSCIHGKVTYSSLKVYYFFAGISRRGISSIFHGQSFGLEGRKKSFRLTLATDYWKSIAFKYFSF